MRLRATEVRHARRDRHVRLDARRVRIDEIDHPPVGVTVGDDDRPLGVGGVEDRDDVGHVGSAVWSSTAAGRPDRPLPRPSNVTTRYRRARSGSSAFQIRECVIGDGATRSSVGTSGRSKTSKEIATPPDATESVRSGSRALHAATFYPDRVYRRARAVVGLGTPEPPALVGDREPVLDAAGLAA